MFQCFSCKLLQNLFKNPMKLILTKLKHFLILYKTQANQSQNVVREASFARAKVLHIITLLLVYVIHGTVTNGQLILRQDGTQNSYSVATPGSQISFSRFYGGQAGQPTQQQVQAQAPAQFLGQGQVFEQGVSTKHFKTI